MHEINIVLYIGWTVLRQVFSFNKALFNEAQQIILGHGLVFLFPFKLICTGIKLMCYCVRKVDAIDVSFKSQ